MSRSRTVVVPPRYSQDEVALVRRFRVPDARDLRCRGHRPPRHRRARPGARRRPRHPGCGRRRHHRDVVAAPPRRHPVARARRRSTAIPTTAWSTAFGAPVGQWVDVTTPQPVTFDHLDLQVVADGKHSVPTQLRIDAGGESRTVDLPAVTDGAVGDRAGVGAGARSRRSPAPTCASPSPAYAPVDTLDYHERVSRSRCRSRSPRSGLPGVQRAAMPATLPADCRTDLLAVDGQPVGVELRGSTADAAAGKPVDLAVCPASSAAAGLDARAGRPHGALGAGHAHRHRRRRAGARLRRRRARRWRSARAASCRRSVTRPPARPRRRPGCRSRARAAPRSSWRSAARSRGTPFWLVLGESNNAGWEASVDGKNVGGSTLVNGYANGWLVHPTAGTFSVTLRWTPQRTVWIALGVSALAFLVCLFLALRRRRGSAPPDDDVPDDDRVLRFTNPLVATGDRAETPRRGRGRDRRRRGGHRARELVGGAARRGARGGGRVRATAAIPHRARARRSHWLRARRT